MDVIESKHGGQKLWNTLQYQNCRILTAHNHLQDEVDVDEISSVNLLLAFGLFRLETYFM